MENNSPFRLSYSSESQPAGEYPLEYGEFILGRSAECDIVLQHPEVSRKHIKLNVLPDGRLWITDLGSGNGTQLEGQPLMPRRVTQLMPGQTFIVGPYQLVVTALNVGQPAAPVSALGKEQIAEVETYVQLQSPNATASANKIPTPIAAPIPAAPAPAVVQQPRPAPEPDVLRLAIQKGGGEYQEYVLENGEWELGRSQECKIHLDDPYISRRHAKITVSGRNISVTDLGSANGVTKNGIKLEPKQTYPLAPGEGFDIGYFSFRLEWVPQSKAAGQKPAAAVSTPVSQPAQPQAKPAAQPQPYAQPAGREVVKPLNLMGLDKVTIGRAADNHVVINHPLVSRYHAVIERMGTRFRIVDTHSANGIYVNGQVVEKEAWLKEGDRNACSSN